MDERQIDFLHQVFTVVEAAAYLKISRALLYKFIHAGDLHTIKLGTRTIILGAELDRFVRAAQSRGASSVREVILTPTMIGRDNDHPDGKGGHGMSIPADTRNVTARPAQAFAANPIKAWPKLVGTPTTKRTGSQFSDRRARKEAGL
jgi:excisionase family DNA binding protein